MIALLTSLVMYFTPVHVMYTEGKTCQAAPRLLKEKVKVVVKDEGVYVNGIKWKQEPQTNPWIVSFHLRPDQFMGMAMIFDDQEAYLTMWGIDEARKPCTDRIYLKRTK